MKLNIVKPITNRTSIFEIATSHIPPTWEILFEQAIDEIKYISDLLEKDEIDNGEFLPNKKDIFKAFNVTKLNDVKVVLIGDCPSHEIIKIGDQYLPKSDGLSYSMRGNVSQFPQYMLNIFKELSDLDSFCYPKNGNLEYWALQGVLLLNMSLTTRKDIKDSHNKIWYSFINKVVKVIKTKNAECVFMLWGKKSRDINKMLGNNTKFCILEAESPDSNNGYRFLGCNHFRLANEHLVSKGKTPIDWNLTPDAWNIPYLGIS